MVVRYVPLLTSPLVVRVQAKRAPGIVTVLCAPFPVSIGRCRLDRAHIMVLDLHAPPAE